MSAWEIVAVTAVVTLALVSLVLVEVVAYLDKADRDAETEADEAMRLGNSGAES